MKTKFRTKQWILVSALFYGSAGPVFSENLISNIKSELSENFLSEIFVDKRTIEVANDRNFTNTSNEESNSQQTKKISGVVVDTNGKPIIGANVIEKGTTNGVVTDIDGRFTLQIHSQEIVQISYIGYNSQDLNVSKKTYFNILLIEDSKKLEEIVVVGYGTVKKSDLVGSVSSISSNDLTLKSASSIAEMLQGKAAGVEIVRSSGRPGAGTSIRVRGTTSLNSTDPLTIVDGLRSSMDMVNPSEIESIEILKDASSTAIYGSRGANGVVIITTKKGKLGAPRLTYNGYYGVATPGKKYDMLNASDYVDLQYDVNGGEYNPSTKHWNKPDGFPVFFDDDAKVRTDLTNWQDELLRNGAIQEHNLDFSGGAENVSYRFALGYFDQRSTQGTERLVRYNIKSSSEYKVNKYLKAGYNLMATISRTTGSDAYIGDAIKSAPNRPIYDPNQPIKNPYDYSYSTEVDHLNSSPNVLAFLALNSKTNRNFAFQMQLYAELEPIKDLKLRAQFQYSRNNYANLSYQTEECMLNNLSPLMLDEMMGYGNSPSWENYANYTKTLGVHTIGGMIGMSYSNNNFGRSLGVNANNFANMHIILPTFGGSHSLKSDAWHGASLSYFGRINYSLMDRYLLTANFRADASSQFAPANRWGYFPSVALGWKIKEESFMKDIETVSSLKLRLSWGKSGNDAIPGYQFYTNVWTGKNNNINYAFGDTYDKGGFQHGATISALPSPNIHWEETTNTNIGLDLGLLANRLQISVDYYDKLTDDILINVPIPNSTGIAQPSYQNAASVTNRGFDLTTSFRNSTSYGLEYSVSVVGGYNRNKVKSLGDGEPINTGETITKEGFPMSDFIGYKVDKVLSTSAEAEAYNKRYGVTAEAGDYAFIDLNGDGLITDQDRAILGNPMPDFNFGLSLSASYRNFDASISGSGVFGNEIAAKTLTESINGMYYTHNATTDVLERWKTEGDITYLPRATDTDPNKNRRFSDRYIQDASFFRITNASLGYTLPATVINAKYLANLLKSCRFYLSADNICTITKYKGMNPESGGNANIGRGVDGLSLALPRTYYIGIQVGF